jgi:hypothetical protein
MQHARMLITRTRPTRQYNTLQRNPPRCNPARVVARGEGLAGQARVSGTYRAMSIELNVATHGRSVAAAHACGCGSMKSRLRGSAPLGCVASNAFLRHARTARARVRRKHSRTGEAAAQRALQGKIDRIGSAKLRQSERGVSPGRTRAEHRRTGGP